MFSEQRARNKTSFPQRRFDRWSHCRGFAVINWAFAILDSAAIAPWKSVLNPHVTYLGSASPCDSEVITRAIYPGNAGAEPRPLLFQNGELTR
ncbi:hypothetical protein PCANC_05267 [Puccinia coronata f. sp. avenae]|uniref:Uncharacterized protein n=1 Tax=Puccinia coronata f. sp. avenae TaxID=200324 RepID=A0A2N5VYV2_9BASI|nr:hypothetical protein PCANC_21348 [Puccinia coronata f. sp. avenae]PLW55122.1 hypothetical protein PCANC_05267 [Puccinia coronata f. sp. avenae]